jgi:hypothetical protein
MTDLITKLVSILHVKAPHAERYFYEHLGLDAAIAACEQASLSFVVEVERPREDCTYRSSKSRPTVRCWPAPGSPAPSRPAAHLVHAAAN